jgi:glycosyltransferase involved in cell wall biosynthesis
MQIDVKGCCDKRGNSYGYTIAHEQMLYCLRKLGHEITKDAEICMQICTPSTFVYEPGKVNILFSMFEFSSVPTPWVKALQDADYIFTPSQYCKELFDRYTPVETWVIPHFVNPVYQYYQREFKKPFVWLWVGALNLRKGYLHLSRAWEILKEVRPDIIDNSLLLYKSTAHGATGIECLEKNVLLDLRVLPSDSLDNDSMVGLYQQANAFVFPSLGEGWGLTLHEAMATGLPCIYTKTTGMKDFAYGFNVKTKDVEVTVEIDEERFTTTALEPDSETIAYNMTYVYDNYDQALGVGKIASEKALNFNISNMMTKLQCALEHIEEVTKWEHLRGKRA